MEPIRPELGDSVARWLLGFFGAVAAFLLLPQAIKFFIRRYLFRTLGKIISFITIGLLTEKVFDWLGGEP